MRSMSRTRWRHIASPILLLDISTFRSISCGRTNLESSGKPTRTTGCRSRATQLEPSRDNGYVGSGAHVRRSGPMIAIRFGTNTPIRRLARSGVARGWRYETAPPCNHCRCGVPQRPVLSGSRDEISIGIRMSGRRLLPKAKRRPRRSLGWMGIPLGSLQQPRAGGYARRDHPRR